MEFNRPVSNPMLMGCIQLMKEENTPEHRGMFAEELGKSVFQAPALMVPEPVQDADGKLAILEGTKIQFPMLMTQDGKKYFMGFTDPVEYRKWVEKNKDLPYFALTFDDLAGMLAKKEGQAEENAALGFIINPMGDSVVVPREMVEGIASMKTGHIRLK